MIISVNVFHSFSHFCQFPAHASVTNKNDLCSFMSSVRISCIVLDVFFKRVSQLICLQYINMHFLCLFVSVCVSFLGKFYQSLKDNDVKFNSADIEKALIKTCKDAKGKENRFVSATAVWCSVEVSFSFFLMHVCC